MVKSEQAKGTPEQNADFVAQPLDKAAGQPPLEEVENEGPIALQGVQEGEKRMCSRVGKGEGLRVE